MSRLRCVFFIPLLEHIAVSEELTSSTEQLLRSFDQECRTLVDSWRLPNGSVIITFESHSKVIELESFRALVATKKPEVDAALEAFVRDEKSSAFMSFVVCRRRGWNWDDMLRNRARTFRMLRQLVIARLDEIAPAKNGVRQKNIHMPSSSK